MSWRKKGGLDEVILILDIVDETDGSRGSVGRGGRRGALIIDGGADDGYVNK